VTSQFPSSRLGELSIYVTSGSRGWAEYYSDNGDVFIRITNLKRGTIGIDTKDLRFVQLPDTSAEGLRTRLQSGDVLVSITAELGLIGYYQNDFTANAYVNQHIALVRPDATKVVPKFLAYSLLSSDVQEDLQRRNDSGSKAGLNLSTIRSIPLLQPPLAEQHRIVEILDVADGAVRKTEALIAAKEQYKMAVAERLLTGKVRFPEFTEPWREARLGKLFTNRNESNRLDLKLLAVTGAEGVIDREQLVKRDTSSEDKSKYLRVCPGDIAYNTMRMWQGVFGLSPMEGIVSPAYTVCVPKEQIYGPYAAHLFKLPAQIALFHRYSQGLVSDTLNLKFPSFARIPVTIPELPEQQRIAECLGLMDREITLLKQQRDALKEQKQGLMQKLLTGEVRLKEFAT
jgi:type I restriction enzyme S subunit